MKVPATLPELQNELVERIRSIPGLGQQGFTAFAVDEVETRAIDEGIRDAVAVVYIGMRPVSDQKDQRSAELTATSAQFNYVYFSVVVAIQYGNAGQGGTEDRKSVALGLLGDIRPVINGYRGKNTRPWVFVEEGPEPAASGNGMVLYSQTWRTLVPVVGPN